MFMSILIVCVKSQGYYDVKLIELCVYFLSGEHNGWNCGWGDSEWGGPTATGPKGNEDAGIKGSSDGKEFTDKG